MRVTKLEAMKLIPYCTGQYCRNFSYRCLDLYKNQVDSYRLKYRCASACFGHFEGFQRFSGDIFIPDRYKLKWVFIKKIATYSASSPLLNLHPLGKYCQILRLGLTAIPQQLLEFSSLPHCHSFFWHFQSGFLNKMFAEKPSRQSSR